MGVFLYVCFMLIVALLLLNLLIALMGDSFASIKARGMAQWRLEKCTIIFDQECLMPTKSVKNSDRFNYSNFHPKMVHVLVRSSDLEREVFTEEQKITDIALKLTNLEGKLDKITKALVASGNFDKGDYYDEDDSEEESDESDSDSEDDDDNDSDDGADGAANGEEAEFAVEDSSDEGDGDGYDDSEDGNDYDEDDYYGNDDDYDDYVSLVGPWYIDNYPVF